jgi:hypothetical protein
MMLGIISRMLGRDDLQASVTPPNAPLAKQAALKVDKKVALQTNQAMPKVVLDDSPLAKQLVPKVEQKVVPLTKQVASQADLQDAPQTQQVSPKIVEWP